MDRNQQMLNSIYQNATTASDSIKTLLPKVEDKPMVESLNHQKAVYTSFAGHAQRLLNDYKATPEEVSPLQKASMWTGVQLNTMIDSTSSHIAEMMIQGGSMGVTDLTKKMKEYVGCDEPIQKLGKQLLAYEQQAIEEMKTYL